MEFGNTVEHIENTLCVKKSQTKEILIRQMQKIVPFSRIFILGREGGG